MLFLIHNNFVFKKRHYLPTKKFQGGAGGLFFIHFGMPVGLSEGNSVHKREIAASLFGLLALFRCNVYELPMISLVLASEI